MHASCMHTVPASVPEAVVTSWPYLPEHVKTAILARLSHICLPCRLQGAFPPTPDAALMGPLGPHDSRSSLMEILFRSVTTLAVRREVEQTTAPFAEGLAPLTCRRR